MTKNSNQGGGVKQRKTEESVRSREAEAENQRRQTTVLVPFLDGETQPLQRILRPLNVRVVGKSRNWKWSLQQRLKDRTSRDDDPGVVYRLKCGDCEQSYIGEMGHTACVRVKEQACYVKNGRSYMSVAAAAEHAIFEQNAFDFDNVEVTSHRLRTSWHEAESQGSAVNQRGKALYEKKKKDWKWTQSGSASFPHTLCSVSKSIFQAKIWLLKSQACQPKWDR